MELSEQDKQRIEKEAIAKILRDNITFSGQIGDYVIHGAIEKLQEYFADLLVSQSKEIESLKAEIKYLEEQYKNKAH